MDSQNSESKIKSLERIQEYPIIKDSFTKASEYYNWIKEKNSTLNSTLTWTENNVKNAMGVIEPIAATRLGSVDNFACNQLDKMENKYPIIKDTSENILKSSNEYYDSSIKPRIDQIVAVKDSTVNVVKMPFRIASHTIEYLSSTTNGFVNKFMSRQENETHQNYDRKEYDLLFGRALKEINTIRQYYRKNVDGLLNILASIYDQSVTKNKELMIKYYEEYSDEVDKSKVDQTNSEVALMQLVAQLSNKLRISARAVSTVCYNHIDTGSRDKLDLIFHKTEQLYKTVSQTNIEEIGNQISMDNVKWVANGTIGLLAKVKDALLVKYKDETGDEPHVEVDQTEEKSHEEQHVLETPLEQEKHVPEASDEKVYQLSATSEEQEQPISETIKEDEQ